MSMDFEGEEWKHAGRGEEMTPALAKRHCTLISRLLLHLPNCEHPTEGYIAEHSPDADYVRIAVAGFSGSRQLWFAVEDVSLLAVLPDKEYKKKESVRIRD